MRVLLADDHPFFLDGLRNLLLARGVNVIGKEIAAAVHLTEDGVKYHMGRILDRLHLANHEEAIAFARRRG